MERAASRLKSAGVDEARKDAWLLLGHVRHQDRATLLAGAFDELRLDELRRYQKVVTRRAHREPLAQIVGRKEFWSLDFRITSDVLCPRPDSECLIEAILARAREKSLARRDAHRVLDLGTGSGCLLLALLSEFPAACGIGVDVSGRALSIARSNGERLNLADRAHWLCASWGAALDGGFDVIVSNPPYIAANDAPALEPEIRRYEPQAALFAGEDGLDAYRSLAGDLDRLLTPGGFACLEIGFDQAGPVDALLRDAGLNVVGRRQDLAGIDRCLIVERR